MNLTNLVIKFLTSIRNYKDILIVLKFFSSCLFEQKSTNDLHLHVNYSFASFLGLFYFK